MTQAQPSSQPPPPHTIDDMLPSDLLACDEDVLFAVKPSPWLILFSSARTLAFTALVIVATLALGPALHLGHAISWIVLAALAFALGRLGFAVMQWVSRTYVLTDRRVIRIRGVFAIDIFQTSLERVQNTFLTFSFLQRLFGLGSIAFTTAGTGGIEAIWRHISKPLQTHHELLEALNTVANRPRPTTDAPDTQTL